MKKLKFLMIFIFCLKHSAFSLNYNLCGIEFQNAIDTIENGTITITCETEINRNVLIPNGVTLIFESEGFLTSSSGDTVTIAGNIIAGNSHIFRDSILLINNSLINVINPSWFGSVPNDAIEDTEPFRKAIAFMNNNSTFDLPQGIYYAKPQINCSNKSNITFEFNNSEIILKESSGKRLFNFNNVSNLTINDMIFNCNNLYCYRTIQLKQCDTINIFNCEFKNLLFDSIPYPRTDNYNMTGAITTSTNCNNIEINQCRFNNWGYYHKNGSIVGHRSVLSRCIEFQETANNVKILNSNFVKARIATCWADVYCGEFKNNTLDTLSDNGVYFLNGDSLIVTNNDFRNGEEAIALKGGYFYIANNNFYGVDNKCVRIDGVEHCMVENNTFQNTATRCGAAVKNVSSTYDHSNKIYIQGNEFIGPIGWAAIQLYDFNKITINDNYFNVQDNGSAGILVWVDNNVDTTIFSYNTIIKDYTKENILSLASSNFGEVCCNIGIEIDEIYYPSITFECNRTKLIDKYCDVTLPIDFRNSVLDIYEINGATSYIAKFECDGEEFYKGLGSLPEIQLKYVDPLIPGKKYNVSIRAAGVLDSNYGESCSIHIPSQTKLKHEYCDITLPIEFRNTILHFYEIEGATSYIAKFECDGEEFYKGLGLTPEIQLKYVDPLVPGKTYNVSIRAAGVINSGYGESCSIYIPSQTRLIDEHCNVTLSVNFKNTVLDFYEIEGATSYIARFECDGEEFYKGLGLTPEIQLKYVDQLEAGKTYNISIRAAGVLNSNYGSVCTMTLGELNDYYSNKNGEINHLSQLDNKNIDVYPNPFSEFINISNPTGLIQISIADISGKIILEESFTNSGSIDTKSFLKGFYVVTILQNKSLIKSFKLLKQ